MSQVFYIHGGNVFNSYERFLDKLQNSEPDYERMLFSEDSWRNWLGRNLTNLGYDFLTPSFPNKQNANYDEWKIYFEKALPLLKPDATLIGYSLGGIFLAKYFSENKTHNFKKLILAAPAYDDEENEDLGNFKIKSARGIDESFDEIHLLHSKDDPIVKFQETKKFLADSEKMQAHFFEDKSHFFVSELPEILEIIKN